MDRLALLVMFALGLLFGRVMDPQFRRDVRWTLLRRLRGEPWEQGIRSRLKKL